MRSTRLGGPANSPAAKRADQGLHGLNPSIRIFFDTAHANRFELLGDVAILRNLGIKTIVGVGVSVNVASQNLAFDAVNAAYQVVIARDAVTGFPLEYVDQVFQHTLGGITTVLESVQIQDAWLEASS